jgi:hypothetical protein
MYRSSSSSLQLEDQLALPIGYRSVELLHDVGYKRLTEHQESENQSTAPRDGVFRNKDGND